MCAIFGRFVSSGAGLKVISMAGSWSGWFNFEDFDLFTAFAWVRGVGAALGQNMWPFLYVFCKGVCRQCFERFVASEVGGNVASMASSWSVWLFEDFDVLAALARVRGVVPFQG